MDSKILKFEARCTETCKLSLEAMRFACADVKLQWNLACTVVYYLYCRPTHYKFLQNGFDMRKSPDSLSVSESLASRLRFLLVVRRAPPPPPPPPLCHLLVYLFEPIDPAHTHTTQCCSHWSQYHNRPRQRWIQNILC